MGSGKGVGGEGCAAVGPTVPPPGVIGVVSVGATGEDVPAAPSERAAAEGDGLGGGATAGAKGAESETGAAFGAGLGAEFGDGAATTTRGAAAIVGGLGGGGAARASAAAWALARSF